MKQFKAVVGSEKEVGVGEGEEDDFYQRADSQLKEEPVDYYEGYMLQQVYIYYTEVSWLIGTDAGKEFLNVIATEDDCMPLF